MSIIALTGCTSTVEEEPLVVVEQEQESETYVLADVSIGDVVRSQRIRCVYKQTNDEEISFSVSGKRIENVYVKKGDTVKKGQLLAQLSGGNLDQDIDRLEYNIARNEILKKHAVVNEDLEISQRWVNAIAHFANQNVEEDVKRIQRNYRYLQEDYDDALELDRMELKKLKADKSAISVYAGMDGVVYSIEDHLEGATSERDKVIMTIIDNSECLFMTEDPTYNEYYSEGEKIHMSITSTGAAGDYEIVPWHMDEWGEEQFFSVVSGPDSDGIEVGTSGYMDVVLDKKENVLCVPKAAVNKAGEDFYVYVVGANNMREVKWVKVGVYGNDNVEIIEGLAEGDKVILR